jgi:hypothetical protein
MRSFIHCTFIHSFIHQCFYSSLLGPGLFFRFVIFFTQTAGLLGQVISPSQDRYLHRGQHKHRINEHRLPCLEWDWNPRSQSSSGRRQFMPYTGRPLWSAHTLYSPPNSIRILKCRRIKTGGACSRHCCWTPYVTAVGYPKQKRPKHKRQNRYLKNRTCGCVQH